MEAKTGTIMLIDDSMEFNFVSHKFIEFVNAADRVIEMLGADQALDYLRTNAANKDLLPDLIFLDLNMPVKDGWDFLNEYEPLKDKLSKTPVVTVLTSSDDPLDEQKAKKYSSVKDYLYKPLTQKSITRVMNIVVRVG